MAKVLIIEDEEVLAKVLREKFTGEGYETEVAKDGEEGSAMAKKSRPDVILLDLILPKKHGLAVLEEIKNNPEIKHIPVVVLSNLAEDENIKKALELGASDYFVKAQHPLGEIVEKVSSILIKP
jgi:CheY-like chemotaxis protein